MKMGLTEKQYKHILSKLLEQSEAEPVSATPEAGTSSTQAGGTGYPEVGKWESGVTRGPANQVGVTKWSDVVGSKLTRSKANQLKEQYWPDPRGNAYDGNPSAAPYKKLTPEENHKLNSIVSLILGAIPSPWTQLAASGFVLLDANQYEKEGDLKTANLMYIFAAMGGLSALKNFQFVKEIGNKGMALIGEKLSKGIKLLPKENAIIKKVIEKKDVIVPELKKIAQSAPAQKTSQVYNKYKNSKFNKSLAGDLTKAAALYGSIGLTHDSYYYDLYPEDLEKYQKSRLDAIAERKKKYRKDGGNNQTGGTTQNKK
jgi:hypothetical protein